MQVVELQFPTGSGQKVAAAANDKSFLRFDLEPQRVFLGAVPREGEWIEFPEDYTDPAKLAGTDWEVARVIWGVVEDVDGDAVPAVILR